MTIFSKHFGKAWPLWPPWPMGHPLEKSAIGRRTLSGAHA